MDLAETVLNAVQAIRYEHLDPQTVEAVKRSVVDTMGAAVAGSSGAGIGPLVDLVSDWGGKPEATLLVHGNRVPAFLAALVNGAMARAWDIDDVHEGGGGHLSASIVPALFTLAEGAGRRVSGRDLILAAAIGTDLACRLRLSLERQFGWVIETFAPIGIAVAAGKILALDREQTLSAMGLAYAQCSCNSQGVVDGALSVRLQQGLGAKAGVLAVRFAEIGFTGPRNVFQGTYGLFPLYGRNQYDPVVITRDLGQRFAIVDVSVKSYPCCKHTHIPIQAVQEILQEQRLTHHQIARVTVRTNQAGYDKCFSNPGKRRPRSVVDAQFSIPFTVALIAVKGRVSLHDFCPEYWEDQEILRLAERVEVQVDPELDRIPRQIVPNRVEIETIDGRRFSKYLEFVKGSPQSPMTFEECLLKFEECVSVAARPLDPCRVSAFLEMAANLEHVEDVRSMAGLLVA